MEKKILPARLREKKIAKWQYLLLLRHLPKAAKMAIFRRGFLRSVEKNTKF